ncbi:hypothetical protein VOLCADRAFT_103690 [Volvox carteri f. nagariensis]|uniref:Uncharacterized protein vps33 n=1 Tax=Volvox carteri f. nagariensis TaxID=3068 RepID=D8TNT6_VOLCA|nr:uncharacterized protein VOLCADRAFT_103690 [Volvox carteri f. nagariensis]EFJ51049.1 hypothetical protein VOLCADRAFT_103690 [Volvox carteri f. nagariensis]|eukprot:XP_002948061.1 hypothetical protein VOLCADRAFT_103690 [Volvox carteri f. nagariensis]
MARLKPIKFQLPALDTGPVPLVSIREQARKQLLEVVDSRRGKKALVLDPAISGPLGLLDTALTDLLKEHGVVKLLYLAPGKRLDDPSYSATEPRLSDVPTVLYLVRTSIANAQAVAAQVKSRPKSETQDFSVFFVPRCTKACERILEEEGVLGDFREIGEYCLDMVPYDDDVISLELDTAFYDCVCDGDSTPLYYTAAAITRLQLMFGLIPRVQGKGPAATAVRDMCFRMRRESSRLPAVPPLACGINGAGGDSAVGGFVSGRIDRLILLDREVDLITPMMTQITFEGLVDEVIGIRYGSVPLQSTDKRVGESGDSHGAAGGRGPTAPTPLNSTDPFYREFRDLPFHVATQRLQQYARDARREYSELGSKDLSVLKSFVKGLPKLEMLDRLSDVATPPADRVKQQPFHDRLNQEQAMVEGYEPEASVAFIEELMYRGADMVDVLRLLVLLSVVGGGLPRRQLDSLRMEVLHSYGHQHLLTLNALEKSGLLKAASGAKSHFPSVRKALQLIVPEQEGPAGAAAVNVPSDVSHLYKGYAPLSIRLVETALRTGWGPLQEVLVHLPGNSFDVMQTVDSNGMPVEKPFKAGANGSSGILPSSGLGTAASGGGGGAGVSVSLQGSGSLGAGVTGTAGVGAAAGAQHAETVLVVFIGGVTFAEISALRFLSSRPEWPYKFLVLTTKIVNGRTLLQTFVDPLANEFSASG